MSKNKTTKNHYHKINGLKGRDLQTKIAKQVDGSNWKSGHAHYFYSSSCSSRTQGRGRGKQAAVVIKPNPTRKQPGNGVVTIRNEANRWSDLKPVVKSKKFPESRAKYLDTPISSSSFKTGSSKANVLMDFEIARRKPMKSGESSYPLTRSQVKKGISAAVSHPHQNYSKKADHMIDMFTKGDASNNYKGRQSAQKKLVGDDLVKSMGKLSIGEKKK